MDDEAHLTVMVSELLGVVKARKEEHVKGVDFARSCPELLKMAFRELDGCTLSSSLDRTKFLREALKRFIEENKREAAKNLRHPSPEHLACCQVAAAAELVGFSDQKYFHEILPDYCKDKDFDWDGFTKKAGQGEFTARWREARAAIWVKHKDRRLRDSEVQKKYLGTFVEQLKLYLADDGVREELKRISISYENLSESSELVGVDHLRCTAEVEPMGLETAPQKQVHHTYMKSCVRSKMPREQDPQDLGSKLRKTLRELAFLVRKQLQMRRGGMVSNFVFPISWSNADPDYIADHWELIRGDFENSGRIPLGGTLYAVREIFNSLPCGRLVILGQAGSGKTVLAEELALQYVNQRSVGGLVPVILNPFSWNPMEQSLQSWLIQQLQEEYADLFPGSKKGVRLATRVIEGGGIIPILDGFDNIQFERRSAALSAINSNLKMCGGKIVLTSRRDEFVSTVDDIGPVTRAAVIEIQELTPADVQTILRLSSRKLPDGRSQWAPVLSHLADSSVAGDSALLRILSSPLMASVLLSIYDRSEFDPAELLDARKIPDGGELVRHLYARFWNVRVQQPADESKADGRLHHASLEDASPASLEEDDEAGATRDD